MVVYIYIHIHRFKYRLIPILNIYVYDKSAYVYIIYPPNQTRTFFVFYQSTSKCIHIDFVVGSSTFGRVGCDWNLPWRFPKLIQRHFVKNFNRGKSTLFAPNFPVWEIYKTWRNPLKTYSLKIFVNISAKQKPMAFSMVSQMPKNPSTHKDKRHRGHQNIRATGCQMQGPAKVWQLGGWLYVDDGIIASCFFSQVFENKDSFNWLMAETNRYQCYVPYVSHNLLIYDGLCHKWLFLTHEWPTEIA